MSYNYQDAPSESQSEWLGKKAPELNKNLNPQQFYEWCINLEKRINELEQRQETRPHETIIMWNFTKIEVPKSGDYVWVCNARDKNSKLIKWGTGDEAFYSYWMPADRPKPPQAT